MRYSNEFKRSCVALYRSGIYPETPERVTEMSFRSKVREWKRLEDVLGPDALKHKNDNKDWKSEEKLELVSKVIAGESNQSVAIKAGISAGMLYHWVRTFKIYGYNGLINKKRGRNSRNPDMKKIGTRTPKKLGESEYEELVRLRAENEYIKAENEIIKKRIALREEKEAARLKAKKQKSLKSFEKKDTN